MKWGQFGIMLEAGGGEGEGGQGGGLAGHHSGQRHHQEGEVLGLTLGIQLHTYFSWNILWTHV